MRGISFNSEAMDTNRLVAQTTPSDTAIQTSLVVGA